MTYSVGGTVVIGSDAKIDWNKLVSTPAYFTTVIEDVVDSGTALFSGYEIEDAGSHALALVRYTVVTNCGGNCVNCG